LRWCRCWFIGQIARRRGLGGRRCELAGALTARASSLALEAIALALLGASLAAGPLLVSLVAAHAAL